MKYEHTREHMLPVLVELTYEDLRNIRRMARHFIELETMPDGLWKSDMRRLELEARDAINNVAENMAGGYSFPKIDDTTK
jgi:hypothetical protein